MEAHGVLVEMVGIKMKLNKMTITFAMLLCAALPAMAEIDLSGSWAAKNHEDAMERGAGPNPGDFTALPFNDGSWFGWHALLGPVAWQPSVTESEPRRLRLPPAGRLLPCSSHRCGGSLGRALLQSP